MPICGGAAERRPGTPSHIVVTPDQIASMLPAPLQWLRPFLPYVPPIVIDVDALCDTQPTEVPVLESADLLALVTRNPIALATVASAKVTRLVHLFAWYTLCRCAATATPEAPEPPSEPADLPSINPPGVTAPVASLCGSYQEIWPEGAQSYPDDINWNEGRAFDDDYFRHGGAGVIGVGNQGTPFQALMLPAGAKFVKATIDNSAQNGTVHGNALGTVQFFKADGTSATFPNWGLIPFAAPGEIKTAQGPVPADAVNVVITGTGPNPSNTNDRIVYRLDVSCSSGSFDAPQAACCPPDPTIVGLIDQLMAQVNLIQRQLAPFAYVPDGEVAGLSGAGEVAVQGLVAVSVLLTTLPAHYGMAEGSPDALFDVGYISLGTADGFERSRPIATSPFYVRVGSEVTRIGYSLSPGVVATLRKHTREP